MALDVLFRSIGDNIRQAGYSDLPAERSLSALQASDASEAHIQSASAFLEAIYTDGDRARFSRAQTPMSRAQTPMVVGTPEELPGSFPRTPPRASAASSLHNSCFAQDCVDLTHPMPKDTQKKERWRPPSKIPFWQRLTPRKKSAKPLSQELGPQFSQPTRKQPFPRLSDLPQSPEVAAFAVEPSRDTDYVVLVSMYEVYNDRIFDLLSAQTNNAPMSTRQGAALQKGLMRRPLLFKNTELSPDRKVVAGLRKIVCSTYDEAMMVLETGLHERRVAGTGSNSVSSRSHGFFCIEVKRNHHGRHNGRYGVENWTGGTLSIVDLAGSERARNAKTTGSTLAEAGKINESLMYLGQCLQVQSDCQHDGSKPIIPYRQCKLTELLFSNSFPSSGNASLAAKQPQKAVMVVTADPQGDFNATSQILRYSALAREVTVPRVPSVTSTIQNSVSYPNLPSGRRTPQDNYFSAQELEQATNEVMRLSEECDALAVRLAKEEIKRSEAELKLQIAEERAMEIEAQVREDCWAEMEERIEQEKQRWRAAWEEERLRGERYVDGKLDLMARSPTKSRAR
jgi:hypothetical protein